MNMHKESIFQSQSANFTMMGGIRTNEATALLSLLKQDLEKRLKCTLCSKQLKKTVVCIIIDESCDNLKYFCKRCSSNPKYAISTHLQLKMVVAILQELPSISSKIEHWLPKIFSILPGQIVEKSNLWHQFYSVCPQPKCIHCLQQKENNVNKSLKHTLSCIQSYTAMRGRDSIRQDSIGQTRYIDSILQSLEKMARSFVNQENLLMAIDKSLFALENRHLAFLLPVPAYVSSINRNAIRPKIASTSSSQYIQTELPLSVGKSIVMEFELESSMQEGQIQFGVLWKNDKGVDKGDYMGVDGVYAINTQMVRRGIVINVVSSEESLSDSAQKLSIKTVENEGYSQFVGEMQQESDSLQFLLPSLNIKSLSRVAMTLKESLIIYSVGQMCLMEIEVPRVNALRYPYLSSMSNRITAKIIEWK